MTTRMLIGEAAPDFAELRISRMTDADLVQFIRTADLPFLLPDVAEHLEFHDRQTLERLAWLARRSCQNGAWAASEQRPVLVPGA